MAQPRITSKVLMEKNVSFGLKSIIEETEKHQNGISEDNGSLNLDKVVDALVDICRHPNIPIEALAKNDPVVAEFFKNYIYYGTHALQKVEERLKDQPATAAEEELLALVAKMFFQNCNVPNDPRKDFKDCFIDVDKAELLINTLHHFMDDKKGRRAALYIQAAIEMNWMERPSYNALVSEFPNIGKESNINDYLMHPTNKSKIDEACRVMNEYCSHNI